MARKKRRATQWIADLLVDYEGLPLGRELDYETCVGLVMNAGRARLRRVYFQGLAMSLANGSGEIPYEVAAAACESKAQADRLSFEINAARVAKQKGF